MNAPGFNMQPQRPAQPFQMIPPEVLAQLAASAFRPPQGMGGPGLPGMGGGAPGFNMGEGMAGLSDGLGALGRGGNDPGAAYGRTMGDRDMAGYGASPVDPMSGNVNAQPSEVFNPNGGTSGLLSWMRGLF